MAKEETTPEDSNLLDIARFSPHCLVLYRLMNPEVPDSYYKPRQCGGKHTMRPSTCPASTQGTYNGKTQCLKYVYVYEHAIHCQYLLRL